MGKNVIEINEEFLMEEGKFSNVRPIKDGTKTNFPVSLPTYIVRSLKWNRGDKLAFFPVPEKNSIIITNITEDNKTQSRKEYVKNLAEYVYRTDPKKQKEFLRHHLIGLDYITYDYENWLDLINKELKGKTTKARRQQIYRQGSKIIEYSEYIGEDRSKSGDIEFLSIENRSPEAQKILEEDKKISDEEYWSKEILNLERHLAYAKEQLKKAKEMKKKK